MRDIHGYSTLMLSVTSEKDGKMMEHVMQDGNWVRGVERRSTTTCS